MSLTEPQTREEVEAYLRAKLDADTAETGLYDVGLGFVVVDRIGHDNEVTFHWFDRAMSFDELLQNT